MQKKTIQPNFKIIIIENKKKLEIRYGFQETEFGLCFLGLTEQAVCHLSFHENEKEGLLELEKEWPCVKLILDQENIVPQIKSVFNNKQHSLCLAVHGTDFQIKVWRELLKIAAGSTVSYGQIAQSIGKPTAVRAVASAIAKNNISYLIPCHRVIRKSGKINNYRWGMERKKQMIAFESSI